MSELAEEIASLAEKLTAYGTERGAQDTDGVLRILLADSVIAVTVDLSQCSGTSLVPREGMPGPDSPMPRRGTCPKCGKDVARTMSGHVRAHRPSHG